eukprot:CAMPEP_0202001350 /NCGR_PEP_ID=MMETSP0905-20130828/7470_1 /ASSEMBLY_ACC=CAM_ASM_000554 /TAXON_ID=420261 /ORGANISM="Thalassiosira antarctica, Strain CCMP982" /LENGTH=305 /DNA_ID=CAMNT_0048558033 /DNA_START=89 /DNA_END=1006 /DNA_ORIENTATION=+
MPKTGPERPKELLDALDRNEDIYYFGVGSNLSRTKLENRSVCGKNIHPIRMEPCIIYNCRLAFNLSGFPPVEPAMGSLEPLPSFYEKNDAKTDHPSILKRSESKPLLAYGKQECHGALIKLSAHDYELVYRSEGGDQGALCSYEEIIVVCVPYDKSRAPVRAVGFRVREHARIEQDPCPSKRYMDIIREGAAELGLADSYQQWLNCHPAQEPSNFIKKVGKYCVIFTFTIAHGLKMPLVANIQRMILFQVYVLPTEPRWRQIVGEIAAAVIMLPTACLGLALRGFLESTGLMPPAMKKWIQSNMD